MKFNFIHLCIVRLLKASIIIGSFCFSPLNMMAQHVAANKSVAPKAKVQKTLKDVYKDAFLIGAAVTPDITSGKDKASQDIVIKHFNSITVENVMKAAL